MLLLHLPGSNSIKLCLPVGSLLLHFPKSLYFSLAFFPLTQFSSHQLCFLGVTALLELNNLLLKLFLASACLVFRCDCRLIAGFSFLLEALYAFFLLYDLPKLGFFLLLDVLKHLKALFLENFFMTETFNLTFFDLVDDLRAAVVHDNLAVLGFRVHLLKCLQPLKFHHEVELLLLIDPVALELLILL